MRRFSSLALLAAAAFLFAAPARAEEAPKTKKVANPEYDNWAQFAVGAFVELTTESDSMGQKSTTKMTHKLVELTKEKAVVETSMSMEGVPAELAPKPTRRDLPKELEVPDVKAPETKPEYQVKEGEETIDVAGTSTKCKTWESTVEASGMTTKSKTWLANSIPGGTAKTESKTEGKIGDMAFTSVTSTTVTKWSAK